MPEKQKIKILEIVPAMNLDSGVASFVMNYLRLLEHEKYLVDIAIYELHDTPYYDEIRSYGGKIYLLPAIFSITKHIKECSAIIKEGQYDIVHNNALTKSFPLMWVAHRQKVPVRILHSHNASLGDSRTKRLRSRLVLYFLKLWSTDFFACSNAAGECYFGSCPYNLVPNVINGESLQYDPQIRKNIREKMSVGNRTVICTVGRLAAQKNPFFALDIIRALANRNENIVYWWIGTGAIEQQVKDYAKQLGLDGKVFFCGARSDMAELYQAMDVFFLPSLFEGLPITGIEAQTMGIPCVISTEVTKEVAFTDLVDFVPLKASIEIWVKTIEEQMKRISERRSYTRELENSLFSSTNAGEKLENYYQKMLSEATF